MSRITLSPSASASDLARLASADAYSEHRLLWGFFPEPGKERDFLFRRVDRQGRPSFLVVSSHEPSSPTPAWTVETKDYAPELAAGDRLAFSLRANPVVRRRAEDGRQVRHDVVMDAKRRLREEDPGAQVPVAEVVHESGSTWLQDRADRLGVAIDPGLLRVDGYRQHRVTRRGQPITFSSLEFEGLLRVTDSERLVKALFRGVGPSKAFGCGLLLVRRA